MNSSSKPTRSSLGSALGLAVLTLFGASPSGAADSPRGLLEASASVAVKVSEDPDSFTLANGVVVARVDKHSGVLVSLQYGGLELLAQGDRGSNGGYWSSVGRGRPGSRQSALVRIDPATNGGVCGEISCRFSNDPGSPTAPVDVDYRYALGRGEHWLYVYSVLEHKPGYPAFGAGEARYCLKLNPRVFDFLSVDANRQRLMPSGEDWDKGAPLNLKEARRMTTGVHKDEAEHKYDYSAVLAETPAYGWSSTKEKVGLWLINPSMEYIGGGPTKAELTGHLDVNPRGLPTLLNMWVGSHYGGTTVSVAADESWTKVVGPFLLYCNATQSDGSTAQQALWHDALGRAAQEARRWPYAWVQDPDYPPENSRGGVTGQLKIQDQFAPDLQVSNIWVGLAAPDYIPPRSGFGFRGFGTNSFGLRGIGTNSWPSGSPTNRAGRGFGRSFGWSGLPAYVDWQRDAKFYQFWARADREGRFTIAHVRPGAYTLHAIADGILGEFTLTNVIVGCGAKALGQLPWIPSRFGRTIWQIGIPDRSAREFRHGDDYWHWGLYFQYAKEFPNDVNFVVGQSDCRRDWNYVQPPRILRANVRPTSEEAENNPDAVSEQVRSGESEVRSTTWSVTFSLPEPPKGRSTLRLAFCGTHSGCNVEVFVNGRSIGETGTLPSTSAMQRDGIRAYWIEKDLAFDAALLTPGANILKLLSHARSWSQGVMYDCLRLELDEHAGTDQPGLPERQ